MIKSTLLFTIKTSVIWAALLTGSIIGSMFLNIGQEAIGTDGPFTGGQAFLLVNGIHAIILAIIAERSHVRGLRLFGLLWLTLYCVQSLFLLIEAIYFNAHLNVPMDILMNGSFHVLIAGGVTGLIACALWRKPIGKDESKIGQNQLLLRIVLAAILYVFAYAIAGYFIAWSAPEVREYYDFGETIKLFPLIMLQLFRGTLWAIMALIIIRSINGRIISKGIIVGVTFSVLATAQLLYPSTFMPWEVRFPHLIEVGISNFIFGFLAVVVLNFQKSKQ